jgi:hypothetical protein
MHAAVMAQRGDINWGASAWAWASRSRHEGERHRHQHYLPDIYDLAGYELGQQMLRKIATKVTHADQHLVFRQAGAD